MKEHKNPCRVATLGQTGPRATCWKPWIYGLYWRVGISFRSSLRNKCWLPCSKWACLWNL